MCLYQCQDCAKTILKWLADHNIEGKLLQLRTRYNDENYIISDRLAKVASQDQESVPKCRDRSTETHQVRVEIYG
ncbi:MAG: papain fold toxin domain-containing protein [Microcystaceae cyanobacterium]